MRIGICTTDFAKQPVADLFARIADMGYECVQLSFGELAEAGYAPTGQIEIPDAIDDALIDAILRQSDAHHLPIGALNGTFNMAHPDARVCDEGLRRLRKLCVAARRLHCPIVTLCSGTRNRAHLWRPHAANGTAAAWTDMLDSMRRAAAIAEETGIVLAVETEASNIVDTPAKARALLEAVESPALRMILDCANLFRAGEAQPENVAPRMREAFEAFGDRIALAHGKDIRAGDGIDFCATGEGIVDYDLFLHLLDVHGYAGDFMIHGVYVEEKMPIALGVIGRALEAKGRS